MILKLSLGLNRVKPVHELLISDNGYCECSKLQNFIIRDSKISKVPSTEAYNSSELNAAISWLHRAYHKRADNSFMKVLFAFADGTIYYGDDVAGTFTATNIDSLDENIIPTHAIMQVSGNSILYFFPGDGSGVKKYDGNGSYQWESTNIETDLGRVVESAVVHLDRMWYISKDSSTIAYSTGLEPENLSDDAADIIVGQEKDSIAKRIMLGANERLYIFKDQSIYELYGRTPSTFQIRRLTDRYGLAAKRAIYPVGGGFIFLNTFDKELYFFGGSESSIIPLTENTIRLREILDIIHIEKCDMTVHKGLFRFAFKHKDDSIYQDRELVYPISEPRPDGTPKWSMIKGNKVYTYALMQQQGDDNILLMGRSDVGKVMYYERGQGFDNQPIETLLRTAELVASEDKDVRFKGFYVKGKPGSQNHPLKFRYYLNGRYATTNEQDLDTKGELRTLGSIKLSTQSLFNNRIIPMHAYSKGNSISFEISDFNLATEIELYSIAVKAQERHKIRSSLTGL